MNPGSNCSSTQCAQECVCVWSPGGFEKPVIFGLLLQNKDPKQLIQQSSN